MSASDVSKYATNQIEVATRNRFPLMSELLADTVSRANTMVGSNPAFATVLANLLTAHEAWEAGESLVTNAEAAVPARTLAFDDFMAGLRRKPDVDTASPLESWDMTIRSQVAYKGTVYMALLPQGRETVTAGTTEAQLDALHNLGVRLSGQTTRPVLVALGTTVAAFADTARSLRTAQLIARAVLANLREEQETRRRTAATAVYALIGQGMVTWADTPTLVDSLWDVKILRRPTRAVPKPPADTAWDAPARRLSTTALPARARRLEAWRRAPGGMPELLHTAAPGATEVIIPASITFTPGGHYQLWLAALNGRGRSTPGPVQNWTAA